MREKLIKLKALLSTRRVDNFGYAGCGYFSLSAATQLRDTMVRVKGIDSLEEMREKEVSGLTPQAARCGVRRGMRGERNTREVDLVLYEKK
ncbi:MAG: DUF1805 domain-containing protein [Candidatus Omnitrophica bacterium]|nr:DUF1805 domain-containing protein [Candidatus Omnitrophota bacterium]